MDKADIITLHEYAYWDPFYDEQRWRSFEVRTDSMFAPSQWETSLQCNGVSHWLSASLESALEVCDLNTACANLQAW